MMMNSPTVAGKTQVAFAIPFNDQTILFELKEDARGWHATINDVRVRPSPMITKRVEGLTWLIGIAQLYHFGTR